MPLGNPILDVHDVLGYYLKKQSFVESVASLSRAFFSNLVSLGRWRPALEHRTQNKAKIKHGALVSSSGSTQLEEALYVLHSTQQNLWKLYILHENKVLFSKYSTDFVFYSGKKSRVTKLTSDQQCCTWYFEWCWYCWPWLEDKILQYKLSCSFKTLPQNTARTSKSWMTLLLSSVFSFSRVS